MKALILGGMPGTGKTRLMKAFLEKTGFDEWRQNQPVKLVDVMFHDKLKMAVVGKYDKTDSVFQGTDTLSMAVQPQFEEYLKNKELSPATVLLEGDRLFNRKTIDLCLELGYDTKVMVLLASDGTLKQRYKDRGSDQSETFIASRNTKIANVVSAYGMVNPGLVQRYYNESEEHLQHNLRIMLNFFWQVPEQV